MKLTQKRQRRIGVFGHFAGYNFGNDSTLQAILYHIQRYLPNAQITCICTNPVAATQLYNVHAVPLNGVCVKPLWLRATPFARLLRRIIIGVPSELYKWFEAVKVLWGMEMLIISGTGLLTDAYGIFDWGPYNLFKWSLTAKLCGCRLLFLSVGAGPLYRVQGRRLVKAALALADFRSYRDDATKEYLKAIGLRTTADKVRPDLVFSLPESILPKHDAPKGRRLLVGLGLMLYNGELNINACGKQIYSAYLETLAVFVRWLLDHEYDVKLLIGDISDRLVICEFTELLKKRLVTYDAGRIIEEPVVSVENLLSQLMTTDVVVATRFHNTLLALMLNKPVISISFHQKCTSLMSEMGLSQYCQDIEHLDSDRLIEQFCNLGRHAGSLRPLIRQKAERCRRALDDQYNLIFQDLGPR